MWILAIFATIGPLFQEHLEVCVVHNCKKRGLKISVKIDKVIFGEETPDKESGGEE